MAVTKRIKGNYNILSIDPVGGDSVYMKTHTFTLDGNFIVNGTVSSIKSIDTEIHDNIITLNKGESGNGISKRYSGIMIDRGEMPDVGIRYDEDTHEWYYTKNGFDWLLFGSGYGAGDIDSLDDGYANYEMTNSLSLGLDSLKIIENNLPRNAIGIGINVGKNFYTGFDFTGIGVDTFAAMQNGNSNIGIGNKAGMKIQGNMNLLIGHNAVSDSVVSHDNTVIGHNSGIVLSGGRNIIFGNNSGNNISNGAENMILGHDAGNNLLSGNNNIVLGRNSSVSSANISNEITIGNGEHSRLRIPGLGLDTYIANAGDILSWDGNRFVWISGNQGQPVSQTFQSDGINNVFLLNQNTVQESVIVSINGVLQIPGHNYTVSNNILVFNELLPNNEIIEVRHLVNNSVSSVTAGANAIDELTDARADYVNTGSIGLGIGALVNMQSNSIGRNTTLGVNAGRALSTGGNLLAIGNRSGEDVTVGDMNISIGNDGLSGVMSGNRNIVMGHGSLSSTHNVADDNIVIGHDALHCLESSGMVVIGNNVADNITLSGNGVILGNNAVSSLMETAGDVIIGNNVASRIVSSNDNVIIGNSAADLLETGMGNIVIGSHSGSNIVSGNNNIVIGYNNNGSVATISDEITIGNNSHAHFRYYGTLTSLSDGRDKTNIRDLDIGLNFIKELRPVKFDWSARNGGRNDANDIGFIAQEVMEAEKRCEIGTTMVNDNNEDELTVSLMKMIPILVNTVKELSQEIQNLQEEIREIRNNLDSEK